MASSSPGSVGGRSKKRRRAYVSTVDDVESLRRREVGAVSSIQVAEEEIKRKPSGGIERTMSFSKVDIHRDDVELTELEDLEYWGEREEDVINEDEYRQADGASRNTREHSNDIIYVDDMDDDLREFLPSDDEDIDARYGHPQASAEDDSANELREDTTSRHTVTGETIDSGHAKGSRVQENVLKEWLDYRQEYLNELHRHEGDVAVESYCPFCGPPTNLEKKDGDHHDAIKCDDCLGYIPRCAKCALKDHMYSPLHRLKKFNKNDFFWEKTSYKALGGVVVLTHDGRECPEPSNIVDITVIDTTGIRNVNVRFCGCVESYRADRRHMIQLLRHGWYPATSKNPKTVATFSVLKQFHILTLQSKISAYDYYHSLVRLTDHTGVETPNKRYDEFLRMVREYRHLKMLMRGGRGLSEDGIEGTKEGELALECPACPHPGVNLPADWKTRPDFWKYGVYVMMDADFKMRSKARVNKDDVELSPGWSYFVEDKAYKEHLHKHSHAPEYCDSGLKAVDLAERKRSKIYDVTGIIAVQCKHMFIIPRGVGDLQLGERFVNGDYVLLSGLKGRDMKTLVISYDIACQHQPKFLKRMKEYPEDMRLDHTETKITHVIPMFHLPGHGQKCHNRFSPYLTEHLARTDGENIERGWAHLNLVALSTREMGKASRQETVNDHLANFNWERYFALGRTLKSRLIDARRNLKDHLKAHEEFSRSFPVEVQEEIKKEIKEWNSNPDKCKNPYSEPQEGTTLKDVQAMLNERERRLKERDAQQSIQSMSRSSDGSDTDVEIESSDAYGNQLTAVNWLMIGLELEDKIISLKETYEKMTTCTTKHQKTLAEEKNSLLFLRLKAWKESQKLIMSGLQMPEMELLELSASSGGALPKVYDIPLRLPSALDKEVRERACTVQLVEYEIEMRKAQAEDALEEARRVLRKGYKHFSDRVQNVHGQSQATITRSQATISSLHGTRDSLGASYIKARNALLRLDPDGNWKDRLKVLDVKKDLQPLGQIGNGTGMGHFISSWIWRMEGITLPTSGDSGGDGESEDNETVDEGLRVEWARSHARLERWKEEIILVKEEMRRVIVYLYYRARHWVEKGKRYVGRPGEIDRGRIAYANRQAFICISIARGFSKEWKDYLEFKVDDNRDDVECNKVI